MDIDDCTDEEVYVPACIPTEIICNSAEVQYSDMVTLSACLRHATDHSPIANRRIRFTLRQWRDDQVREWEVCPDGINCEGMMQSHVCTDENGWAHCSVKLDEPITWDDGPACSTLNLLADFLGSPPDLCAGNKPPCYLPSGPASCEAKVTCEDATISADPMLVKCDNSAGPKTASFTFAARVEEQQDGCLGDIEKAGPLAFKVYDFDGRLVARRCAVVVPDAARPGVGTASVSLCLPVGVYTVTVSQAVAEDRTCAVTVAGVDRCPDECRCTEIIPEGWRNCYYCAAPYEACVVVYCPEAGFVTGGGYITCPDGPLTTGPCRKNFGFNVKYKRARDGRIQDVKGEFTYLDHCTTPPTRLKMRNFDWLVIDEDCQRAIFQGLGTMTGLGSARVLVEVWDKGEPGSQVPPSQPGGPAAEGPDLLGIRIKCLEGLGCLPKCPDLPVEVCPVRCNGDDCAYEIWRCPLKGGNIQIHCPKKEP